MSAQEFFHWPDLSLWYVVFFTLSLNLALFRLVGAINKRAVIFSLWNVKETKGNKCIEQTAERVERSEKEDSQVGKVGKVGECEFNVKKFLRAMDLSDAA